MHRRVLRDRHGQPVYPIGVNYWPRRTAIEMWTRWDPEGIARDLREMRALGPNTVRFFLRTADFADAEANLRPEALEKLDTFLALCREQGLYTFPTFFVGHMSGMNFPIPWERGCDFYTDPEVLARSRHFVQAIVSRYRDEEAILGWLLSNEITHHTGKRETHVLLGWMRDMHRAIRALDPHRPIAPGDGADDLKGVGLGYPENTLGTVEELREGEDFVSLHHYYGDTDTLRFGHAPAGMVRLCDIGLPVLVEEFGVSTALWAESAQADYFRLILFSSWAAGAAGGLAWCWSDFPTADLPPYTHHPHELFFGITRADGSEKPAAGEMRRFARLMAQVDAASLSPASPQAAILVPTSFHVNYPFRNMDRPRLGKALLEAYTLARMAGFDVVFIREPAPPPENVRLLLVPTAELLSPTWYGLQAWVEAGGVLWAGFGWAVPNLEKLFGVRPERWRNLFTQPHQGTAAKQAPFLRLAEPFGDMPAGEQVSIPAADAPHLPIVPTKARVLAVDGDNHPALTVHAVGRGKAFFCPRSLEWLLTTGIEPHRRSPVHRLYRALRSEAGIVPLFEARHPALSLSVLEDESGTQLLVAINHGNAPLEEEVRCQRPPRRVLDVESGDELEVQERTFRLSLEPWGVRVLEIGG
ncbi:MAG TPA: hypothetical protein EYH31_07580 [Anaerolineae bacterium]|nr:hypothetical protein [Anaerolineae bacterium]